MSDRRFLPDWLAREIAMSKMPLRNAKEKVSALAVPLENHLIKMALFGNNTHWRGEVLSFADQIYDVRLNLKTRDRLTEREYLDAMHVIHDRSIFTGRLVTVRQEVQLPPVMNEDGAFDLTVDWLRVLAKLWSYKEYSRERFDRVLDIGLSRKKLPN